MGTRLGAVSKFGNRTRTRVTRFGNTAGKPVPVEIPTDRLLQGDAIMKDHSSNLQGLI